MKKCCTILLTLSFYIISCKNRNDSLMIRKDIHMAISHIECALDSINLSNPTAHNWAPTKEIRDSAKITWNSFVKQCNSKNYKAAYDIYTKNVAHFKIHLKHSSPRYLFLRDILKPLMDEYENPDSIATKYLNELALEYYMQVASIQLAAEDNPYIPSAHPDTIFDYGRVLNKNGRSEEAHNLAFELRDVVRFLTDNNMERNFAMSVYRATLYNDIGKSDIAIEIFSSLKENVLIWKNEDAGNEGAEDYYDYYIKAIDNWINSLCSNSSY